MPKELDSTRHHGTCALKWFLFFSAGEKKIFCWNFCCFDFKKEPYISQILLKLWLIGNRTSCRPIRSVIIFLVRDFKTNRTPATRSPDFVYWELEDDVTREDSRRRFLAQHSDATLLPHCFEWSKHWSSIASLCWAKSRRCESSCVISP